jgi:hypothetical protein
MRLNGLNKNVNRLLTKFAESDISFAQMKEWVMDTYTPIKIYTTKLNGARMSREMYTVAGPSGNVKYNYQAKGYMILYDIDKAGFRTIVFRNVYKVERDGKTYLVR